MTKYGNTFYVDWNIFKFVVSELGDKCLLHFGDVFLLSGFGDFQDTKTDEARHETQPASGLVRGLRVAGVPVAVLKYGDFDALRDVVCMEKPGAVVAAPCSAVCSLERPIVVWVQKSKTTNSKGDEDVGRLQALSRTTAQLVWVRDQ